MSPIIFVLYVSDLEDWLKFSAAFTYANDTSTSVSTSDKKGTILQKLKKDAINILKFMASNGLVAIPKKTTLTFLNSKIMTTGKLESIFVVTLLVKGTQGRLDLLFDCSFIYLFIYWAQTWQRMIFRC